MQEAMKWGERKTNACQLQELVKKNFKMSEEFANIYRTRTDSNLTEM